MAYRGLSRHVDLEALPEPGARFSLQELIGEGTYGEVYSARETVTGESTVYSSLVLAKNWRYGSIVTNYGRCLDVTW